MRPAVGIGPDSARFQATAAPLAALEDSLAVDTAPETAGHKARLGRVEIHLAEVVRRNLGCTRVGEVPGHILLARMASVMVAGIGRID